MRIKKTVLPAVAVVGLLAVVVLSLRAGGGSLEPPGPPGPTMHTLEEIYNRIGSVSGGLELTGPIAAAISREIAYLDIDDGAIQGESEEAAHSGWIEALAVYYTARQPAATTVTSVGGRAGRRADFSDLTVVKELDKASPKLYLACARGDHIPKVEFDFVRLAGGNRVVYHRITLRDAYITSISPVMTHRTDQHYTHLEEVAFSYSQIEWQYTPYDASGTPGTPETTKWSISENAVPTE